MILVTGGTGQVGTALKALFPDGAYPTRAALDLSDPVSVSEVAATFNPDAIVNCAAYTAVDRAEADEATAMAVNAESVGRLAALAAARDIPFVTLSTDYVFDGTAHEPYRESSPTAPINAYGRSKLAGERAALTAHREALVIRTSWVFSATNDSFVSWVVARGPAGEVRAATDQRSCPTAASDLAESIVAALEARATGLLHLTNSGGASRHEVALEIADLAGFDRSLIEPVTTDDLDLAAPRPAYTSMVSERLDALGLSAMRPWRHALAPAVEALSSASRG